jgi:hypothetical protein
MDKSNSISPRNISPRNSLSIDVTGALLPGTGHTGIEAAQLVGKPVVQVQVAERTSGQLTEPAVVHGNVHDCGIPAATVPKLVIGFTSKEHACWREKKLDAASKVLSGSLLEFDESAAQVEPGAATACREREALLGAVEAGEMTQLLRLLKRLEVDRGPLLSQPQGVELLQELFVKAAKSSQSAIVNHLLETYGRTPPPVSKDDGTDKKIDALRSFWADKLDHIFYETASRDFCLIQNFVEFPENEPCVELASLAPEAVERSIEILGHFLGVVDKNTVMTRIPVFNSQNKTAKWVSTQDVKDYRVILRVANPMLFSRNGLVVADIVRTSKKFSFCEQYTGMPRGKQLLMLVASQVTTISDRIADIEYDTSGFTRKTREELEHRTVRQAAGLASLGESIIQKTWIDFFEMQEFDALCLAHTSSTFRTDKDALRKNLLEKTGMSDSVIGLLVNSWAQAVDACRRKNTSITIPAGATLEEIGALFDKLRMEVIVPDFIRFLDINKQSPEFFQTMKAEMAMVLQVQDPQKLLFTAINEYRDIQLEILNQLIAQAAVRAVETV